LHIISRNINLGGFLEQYDGFAYPGTEPGDLIDLCLEALLPYQEDGEVTALIYAPEHLKEPDGAFVGFVDDD
jgi:hypothetical protein